MSVPDISLLPDSVSIRDLGPTIMGDANVDESPPVHEPTCVSDDDIAEVTHELQQQIGYYSALSSARPIEIFDYPPQLMAQVFQSYQAFLESAPEQCTTTSEYLLIHSLEYAAQASSPVPDIWNYRALELTARFFSLPTGRADLGDLSNLLDVRFFGVENPDPSQ